jgi:hypothetical protein
MQEAHETQSRMLHWAILCSLMRMVFPAYLMQSNPAQDGLSAASLTIRLKYELSVLDLGSWNRSGLKDMHKICTMFDVEHSMMLLISVLASFSTTISNATVKEFTSIYVMWHVFGQYLQRRHSNPISLINHAYRGDPCALRLGQTLTPVSFTRKEVYASILHGILWSELAHYNSTSSFLVRAKNLCKLANVFYVGECWHGVGHAAYYQRFAATHAAFSACRALTPGSYAMPYEDMLQVLSVCNQLGDTRCTEGAFHSYFLYWPWHISAPKITSRMRRRNTVGYPWKVLNMPSVTNENGLLPQWRWYLMGNVFT